MSDVEEIGDHWQAEARDPHDEGEPRAAAEIIDTAPREVSEEQWKRIAEAEEKFAEVNFRRNPLA